MASLADVLTKKDLKQYIDTIGKITDVEFATFITTVDATPEQLTTFIMTYIEKAGKIDP